MLTKSGFRAALCPALISLFSMPAYAQTSPNRAFAITSKEQGMQHWTEVKQVDLTTGAVISSVFENTPGKYEVYDGRSLKPIALSDQDSTSDNKRPFSGLSAACAYDAKLNRLYFIPIFINQLRYIDLSAKVPAVYNFENEAFSSQNDLDIEANQFTRMVIAPDGNGYALNNDGSHLIRFTTGTMPVITELGGLVDDPANDSTLVSDPNTSWGGDLVADAASNLYLISARNLVYKIDVQTRVASFVKEIQSLPAGFTTNGAVVDANGQLILSSANSVIGYYTVDPSTWEAKLIPSDSYVFNTSDLANENVLFKTSLPEVKVETPEKVAVYPNPVKTNSFKVTFTNKTSGNYNVLMMDIAGRMISDKVVSVYNSGQVAEVKINPSMTRGIYLVKVLSHENKEIYSRKILVE